MNPKGGSKQHYTAKEVVTALRKARGMVYLTAEVLGCSHTTIYNYAKRYTSVRKELEYQRGLFLDRAESKLMWMVDEGQPWAIQFALRTLGKSRGYAERQEITGAEGGPIKHEDVGLTDEKRIARVIALLNSARDRRDRSPDE